jgi:hypothetical protein
MSDLSPRPTPGTLDPGPSDPGALDTTDLGLRLATEFRVHDDPTLAPLSPTELAAQAAAREALWLYVDQIWHRANATGAQPPPVVVILRDLTYELHKRTQEIVSASNED